MKKQPILLTLLLFFIVSASAQNEYFVGFAQIIDVKPFVGDSFKLEGAVKLVSDMEVADIAIFARVHKQDDSIGFLKKTEANKKVGAAWDVHTINGIIDENADVLLVGGYCAYNGQFYFDDYKLSIQRDGKWVDVPLENGGFENTNFEKVTHDEKTYDKKMIHGWGGFIVRENRATFTPFSTQKEVYAGEHALLVEGKGYFYAPAILKKYEGEWDVEYVPSLSENTFPEWIIKAVMKTTLIGADYVLRQDWYGKQVFDEGEQIFRDHTQISYHPDLGKLYATETLENFPPTILEGTLSENGNLKLTALELEGDDSRNENHIYTWLNEDEFSMIHEFNGMSGKRVKIYFKVTRRK